MLEGAAILLANYAVPNCGVHQYGRTLFAALSASQRFRVAYADVESLSDLDAAVEGGAFAAVLVNYHPQTMGFLLPSWKRRYRTPCIAVMHEMTQQEANRARRGFFQAYAMGDPTLREDNAYVFSTGRIIPPYTNPFPVPDVPTIGSFGFSVTSKGFQRLVDVVQREFDRAIIKINIPPNGIIDPDGALARKQAELCRKALWKKDVQLEVTHEFFEENRLLEFLARNSMNAFLYDRVPKAGISSAVDRAMTVRRPLAVTRSIMFRHLHGLVPPVTIEDASLKAIMENGTRPFDHLLAAWSPEGICRRYEEIIARVLSSDNPSEPVEVLALDEARDARASGRDPGPSSFADRALNAGRVIAGRVLSERVVAALPVVLADARRRSATAARYAKWRALMALGLERPDWRLNRILDDRARVEYAPTVRELEALVPDLMAKKIRRANVQQAFVFDAVRRLVKGIDHPRMLCIGSYEDSAAAALKKLGYALDEIDPVVNQLDLAAFCRLPSTRVASYDVVFSTSVVEHVRDDEEFMRQVEMLLAPGGVGVHTCDFMEGFRTGDPLIGPNYRFYTKDDLARRLMGALRDCDLEGSPSWDCSAHDFHLGGFDYAFASFVFRKREHRAS